MPTESELRSPLILTKPMSWPTWRLRNMILDSDRRRALVTTGKDPNAGEPWRVADPADVAKWITERERKGRK